MGGEVLKDGRNSVERGEGQGCTGCTQLTVFPSVCHNMKTLQDTTLKYTCTVHSMYCNSQRVGGGRSSVGSGP